METPAVATSLVQNLGHPLVRLLAERLLLPLPAPPPARPVPPDELWLKGHPGLLDGDLFLDGSLLDGHLPPEAHSLGWAVVALHDDRPVSVAVLAGGLPPGLYDTDAVELW
eukprot:5368950-Pyramimonas_sp.AAC.1